MFFYESWIWVEVCLLGVCGIILLICVILVVLFVVELLKYSEDVFKLLEVNNGGIFLMLFLNFIIRNFKLSVCSIVECFEFVVWFK